MSAKNTLPTIETITNLYLYNQKNIPTRRTVG